MRNELKGEVKTITVAGKHSPREVEATVYGPLAINRAVSLDGGEHPYVRIITHVATGRAVPGSIGYLHDLQDVLTDLLKLDWAFDEPKEIPVATITGCRRLLNGRSEEACIREVNERPEII